MSKYSDISIENFNNIFPPLLKYKLLKAGFKTIIDLLVRGPLDISEAIGTRTLKGFDIGDIISNDATIKLQQLGIVDTCFVSAEELHTKRKRIGKISTGSKRLNQLLHGGIETGAITEIYGKKNAGILWLCYTLCILVQQDSPKGGLGGNAIFIDSRRRFNSRRLHSIAMLRDFHYSFTDFDPRKVLKNTIILRPACTQQLEQVIQLIGHLIYKGNVKLIIFDSMLSHYSKEFYERSMLAERQQLLHKHITMLKRIAEIYNVAILYYNDNK